MPGATGNSNRKDPLMSNLDVDDHVHIFTDNPATSCPKACADAVRPCGTRRSADASDETVCGRFPVGHDGPHKGWDSKMHLAEWA